MDKITYNTDIIKSIQAITNVTNSMQNLELAKAAVMPAINLYSTINPQFVSVTESAMAFYQQMMSVINKYGIKVVSVYSKKVSAEE